jgi:hypothetical protein
LRVELLHELSFAGMKKYIRVRTVRFLLWGLFVVAIPLALVCKVELPADYWLRFIPFAFLLAALVTGFAERKVRLHQSLPAKSFGSRHR